MTTLTDKQNQALIQIKAWARSTDREPFVLAGYAGTGKTTLLRAVVEELRAHIPIACATPTGKAAEVLTNKLNGQAVTTLHSLLYTPTKSKKAMQEVERLLKYLEECPEDTVARTKLAKAQAALDKLSWAPKENVELTPGTLVIVDEASMVPMWIINDVLKHGCKLLAVGDSFQLPPVEGKNIFSELKPNVLLEEIHRQAMDSGIIRASMRIRQERREPEMGSDGDDFIVRSKRGISHEEMVEYDQILCGKNVTRVAINRRQRFVRGMYDTDNVSTIYPVEGDKVICIRNVKTGYGYEFINGEQFIVGADSIKDEEWIELTVKNRTLAAYPHQFELAYGFRSPIIEKPRNGDYVFDYGYAITVHKSQGSEWSRVILADDGFCMGKPDRLRWLYTGITRAQDELLWLK